MYRWVLAICFFGVTTSIYGQVDVGVGADLGFPLLFNSNVKSHNHASAVLGGRAIISYAPKEAAFTGSLVIGAGPVILPVARYNLGQDVLYMNFLNTNVSLLGRFKKDLGNEAELLYGIGAGANFLKGTDVQVSKRSETPIMRVIEDSSLYNNAVMPAVYLNVEYTKSINPDSRLRYGLGAQLHYIYFLSSPNEYRIDIIDEQFRYFSLKPELIGHMLNPMVYVNLYYRLGD